ncbi:ABC transporter substrate-binding protein [Bifidobacterium pullorum subsp. saeculare]|uniref:ABC transporter substrate-binding protein n=1 Tax=Bifidobacterium pullorum subsp. saeculare TaxID=78257 RepID=A0A938WZ64_9BIFI|nr:ABC transporter substrate-binding protein [Bifidobacterium pullorum]MBM6700275.1 ABC transporter substrate-binding protein [Bifidobacterium pullorum subsp. saeculare]
MSIITSRNKFAVTLTAAVAAATMALSGCGSSGAASGDSDSKSSGSSSAFVFGGLWPQTGTLAYLYPPEEAGYKLAIKDINDAGGVLGKKVTSVDADTSDADHADQNASAAQSVLSKKPSVVIGPAASGVVKNTYKTFEAAKIPIISMGSTSADFSGLSPYFFRTVAPDAVQGAVMGQLIAQDGVKNLAIAAFNDPYGTGLRDTVAKTAKAAGVNIVYGEKDAFDPTETNFSSIATAIKAANPDATLIVSYDQSKPLIKALAAAGVDTHKLYLVDGNTVDFSKDFQPGLISGAKGTIPGGHPTEDFVKQLKAQVPDMKDTTYAAETYDAAILAALAAQKGGKTDGETVKKNLPAVSGANGGTKCTSYKDCLALLKDGKDIEYQGQAGIGPFNADHDPSTASIGIYKYDADNKPVFDHAQQGAVPKK